MIASCISLLVFLAQYFLVEKLSALTHLAITSVPSLVLEEHSHSPSLPF